MTKHIFTETYRVYTLYVGTAEEIRTLYKCYTRAGRRDDRTYGVARERTTYFNGYVNRHNPFPTLIGGRMYGMVFIDQPYPDEYGCDDDHTWCLLNADNVVRLLVGVK